MPVRLAAVGPKHALVVSDNTLYVAGESVRGNRNLSSYIPWRDVPTTSGFVIVPGPWERSGERIVQIAAGPYYSLVRTDANKVYQEGSLLGQVSDQRYRFFEIDFSSESGLQGRKLDSLAAAVDYNVFLFSRPGASTKELWVKRTAGFHNVQDNSLLNDDPIKLVATSSNAETHYLVTMSGKLLMRQNGLLQSAKVNQMYQELRGNSGFLREVKMLVVGDGFIAALCEGGNVYRAEIADGVSQLLWFAMDRRAKITSIAAFGSTLAVRDVNGRVDFFDASKPGVSLGWPSDKITTIAAGGNGFLWCLEGRPDTVFYKPEMTFEDLRTLQAPQDAALSLSSNSAGKALPCAIL